MFSRCFSRVSVRREKKVENDEREWVSVGAALLGERKVSISLESIYKSICEAGCHPRCQSSSSSPQSSN